MLGFGSQTNKQTLTPSEFLTSEASVCTPSSMSLANPVGYELYVAVIRLPAQVLIPVLPDVSKNKTDIAKRCRALVHHL